MFKFGVVDVASEDGAAIAAAAGHKAFKDGDEEWTAIKVFTKADEGAGRDRSARPPNAALGAARRAG
jgi:hypothetical protein